VGLGEFEHDTWQVLRGEYLFCLEIETLYGNPLMHLDVWTNLVGAKVETTYHDNDLILTPIISPQSF
jgi:hypothetical protein